MLRKMVHEMESLEDIKGFITYSEEEVKESAMIKTDGDDPTEEEKKVSELE